MKHKTSIALSEVAKRLIGRLAAWFGISHSAVIEMAVRRLARDEGIDDSTGEDANNSRG